MKKFVVYPFDKIARGLVTFKDILAMELTGVIDFAIHVGEDSGLAMGREKNGIPITSDIESALDGIDVLVVNSMSGPIYNEKYMRMYEELEIEKHVQEMILLAAEKNIEIVCTHDMPTSDLGRWLKEHDIRVKCYSKTKEEMDSYIKEGKQFNIDHKEHRIAVYGTRCCVGKYTVQMHLLRAMKQANMDAAAIISEPIAMLYDQYDADQLRYNVNSDPERYVKYVDSVIRHASHDNHDYLIFSDQQGLTTQYCMQEVGTKLALLKDYEPDSILLVAGYDDDDDIRDCMDLFRIYCDRKKPFAILIPDQIETTYGVYETITPAKIQKRAKEIQDKFGVEHVLLVKDVDQLITKFVE